MSKATKRKPKPRGPRQPAPIANVTVAFKGGAWSKQAAPKPPRMLAGVLIGLLNANTGDDRD